MDQTHTQLFSGSAFPLNQDRDLGSRNGFQGSPTGTVDYLAIVQSSGDFTWQYAGGLGNCGGADIAVLPYGSNQTFNGWNVQAAENGTTFVNQSSGHGMFVSVESTHPI